MGLNAIRSLDYTVLLCRDIHAMQSFYKDVMGFAVEHDGEAWVSFRIGAALLTLRPRIEDEPWSDGAVTPESASVQLAFRVPPSAVDACFAELKAAGVAIVREPTDLPAWRHRALFFRDPESNLLEIYAEY